MRERARGRRERDLHANLATAKLHYDYVIAPATLPWTPLTGAHSSPFESGYNMHDHSHLPSAHWCSGPWGSTRYDGQVQNSRLISLT